MVRIITNECDMLAFYVREQILFIHGVANLKVTVGQDINGVYSKIMYMDHW